MNKYRFHVLQEFHVVYELEADSLGEAKLAFKDGLGQAVDQVPGGIIRILDLQIEEDI